MDKKNKAYDIHSEAKNGSVSRLSLSERDTEPSPVSKLNEEKKLRIINACLQEFSKKLFKEASTDEIAAKAGISKGALFQYFGTKKKLYLYIFHYSYKLLMEEFMGQADMTEPDLLKRLKGIAIAKMNLYQKHPDLFNFILNSYTRETDKEIRALTTGEYEAQKPNIFAQLMENVDFSKFKEGYDPKQIASIISWTVEGFANFEVSKLKNEEISVEKYNQWIQELDKYLDILRKAFYKESDIDGQCN